MPRHSRLLLLLLLLLSFMPDVFAARLAEANLQGIVRDILGVYETEGRRAVAEAVSSGGWLLGRHEGGEGRGRGGSEQGGTWVGM